jgi:hypothetical protein
LQSAMDLIVDNGAGVVIYLRDGRGRRHSLECVAARQRPNDIETQILADLGVAPRATVLFPDPLVDPTGGEPDVQSPRAETFGEEVLFKTLPGLDIAPDRQRAMLHTVFTPGRRRPRKVQL